MKARAFASPAVLEAMGKRSRRLAQGATAHGKKLLELGYTIDQVVHDYGDLCQAITSLAVERDAPFGVDEFRTLNRCLDAAIADAVTEFSTQRDRATAEKHSDEANERMGFLVHELGNYVLGAKLAINALETGSLPMSGATGSVLKKNIKSMSAMIAQTAAGVRHTSIKAPTEVFSVHGLVADALAAARLVADARGCELLFSDMDREVRIRGNREALLAALNNLLLNAFKFTRPRTEVGLAVHADASGCVVIEVSDHCGGLPPDAVQTMFLPFVQAGADRTGLGLGLAIAQRSVEANGGKLSVRDSPGVGCVFSITLPTDDSSPEENQNAPKGV